MKKFQLFFCLISSLLIGQDAIAQTGPGGVGSSSDNILWLDAGMLGLNHNDLVSSWTDTSGNDLDAVQGDPNFQPTFLTNQLNGHPVVSFDGFDNRLEFGSNITTGEISTFIVYKRPTNSISTILGLSKHMFYTGNNVFVMIYLPTSNRYNIGHVNDEYTVFSMHTDGSTTGSNLQLRNNTNQASYTRASLWNNSNSTIGCRKTNGGSFSLFADAEIAEVIVFNTELNTAKHNIINNYLAAKYDLPIYTDLFVYQDQYGFDVKGLGTEADGSHDEARGNDSLKISSASSPDVGDYILIGNDNAGYGTNFNVSAAASERWDQLWRADISGDPGTVSLEFFLGSNGFGVPNNYVVIIDSVDSDFSNGGSKITGTGSFQASTNSIVFTNVSIPDGSYFTLAQKQADITSTGDGDWNTPGTWSCTCIPGETEIVSIQNTHDITVSGNQSILNLTIETGGTLSQTSSDTLFVLGNLELNGSYSAGSGTIAATSSSSAQTFDNNSVGTFALNNLLVSNTNGLFAVGGDWSLSGSLQVESGGLDVTGTNEFLLISDAAGSSQILESMADAFDGDFTIQRYIGARNAGYGNFSPLITDATVADIDDDLFLSGVGGANGNATVAGGGIFYSLLSFNIDDDQHDTINSLAHAFKPGVGYEVYLATVGSTFSATTIDYVGNPNSGDVSSFDTRVNNGWNLLGNPYHAFLAWDSVEKHVSIGDDYYVYNTDNGSYDFFTGNGKPLLAPGQGFWIFQGGTGARTITFTEADKGSGTTSDFIRKKFSNDLMTFELSSLNSFQKHKFYVRFDTEALKELDDLDRRLLESPLVESAEVYSRSIDSDEKLVLNAINPLESSHLIPLEVETGIPGEYNLDVNHLEHVFSNYSCIYLKDNSNGMVTDLTINNSYSFQANAGSNQFSLVLSNSADECDVLLEQNTDQNQVLHESYSLRNTFNDWYLDYELSEGSSAVEIRIFNMSGQLVSAPQNFSATGNGSIEINGTDKLNGIYLIQIKTKDEFINKTVKL